MFLRVEYQTIPRQGYRERLLHAVSISKVSPSRQLVERLENRRSSRRIWQFQDFDVCFLCLRLYCNCSHDNAVSGCDATLRRPTAERFSCSAFTDWPHESHGVSLGARGWRAHARWFDFLQTDLPRGRSIVHGSVPHKNCTGNLFCRLRSQ